MVASWRKLLVLLFLPSVTLAQVSVTTAPLNWSPPPEPPSRVVRPPLFSVDPGPPPTPDDLLLPDLNTLPIGARAGSRPRRFLQQFMPRCLDFMFHTCWASPPRAVSAALPESDREAARNVDVGDFYFHDKNYRAAESRYREALQSKPDDPDVTFKLAAAVDKLGRSGEALDLYRAYLALAPAGASAQQASNAIQRLEKTQH